MLRTFLTTCAALGLAALFACDSGDGFEAASETIRAEHLAQGIGVLAADSMGGRAPASWGEQRTVRYLQSRFEALQEELPIVEQVRVRGLMVGVDLSIPATPAVGACMERGLLINATHDTVVRLLPPLNVTAEQVDEGCEIVSDVLRMMSETD